MKCTTAIISFMVSLAACTKLNAVQKSAESPLCADWKCSKGWHLNGDKAHAPGRSDNACCLKTCALHKCNKGFVDNPDYHTNVGQTDKDCCDISCKRAFEDSFYECKESRFPSEDPARTGVSALECCEQTCADYTCEQEGWFLDDAKKSTAGSSDEACCTTRCKALTCQAHGYLLVDETLDKVTTKWEDCCTMSCDLVECPVPLGFHHPLRIRYPQLRKSSVDECCFPQCRHHKCSENYTEDVLKADLFDPTDDSCCLAKCAAFECPVGYVLDVNKTSLLGNTRDECCIPSCNDFAMCNTTGWAPKKGARDTVYDKRRETCCVKTCWRHRCPQNFTVPAFARGVAMEEPNPDEYCCEPVRCRDFRIGSTLLRGEPFSEVCNKISKADCAGHHMQVKEEGGDHVMLVGCGWDKEFGLCRLDVGAPDNARGCFETPA
eukprot:TRINITY_DN40349_c0_g1_i1.p1 TRINITY_DN40349_c0_g1~~TRINITY_DN40349_c0_g1_i1.p1  ORF type:complete len:435 (+),score=63.50 TRINITY_DN40349_c0_g1_i1:192-1496(+)